MADGNCPTSYTGATLPSGARVRKAQWLLGLTDEEFGHVAFHIDLLQEEGVHLDEPYMRQLRGKLRELRFHLGRDRPRISYYIASGRRIVLLTVFRKTKMREVQGGRPGRGRDGAMHRRGPHRRGLMPR